MTKVNSNQFDGYDGYLITEIIQLIMIVDLYTVYKIDFAVDFNIFIFLRYECISFRFIFFFVSKFMLFY